jgi:arabinofuranosyltransferase
MQSKRLPSRLVASLSSPWKPRDTSYVLLALSLIVFAKNFWLSEDAYIHFRSLEQLRAGHGAVWNLGERVQIYTCVAWFWLQAAVNLPLHNVFAATIGLTVFLFVTLLALARRVYGDTPALWFLLVSFMLSKGFFDYTSAGHENILVYNVLLALYAAYRLTASSDPAPPRQLYLIAAMTGLVPLVRYDVLPLCVPPFAWLLWRGRHHWRRELVLIALAGLPLLLWTLASLVYYGLPFPNTAYAKLNHGLAAIPLLKRGLAYLYWNGRRDPLTMLIIAVAPVVAFWKLQSWQRAFALGVVLYCLYLCKIGGDYLAGRFLSYPFLVAALLAADWLQSLKMPRAAAWAALATTTAYLWLISATPLLTPWTYGRELNTLERILPIGEDARITGVLDARPTAYSTTLAAWWRNEPRALCCSELGRREGEALHSGSEKVVVRGAVGMAGYYAGLNIHIVDCLALADPFLSHLPAAQLYCAGHYPRYVPGGYLEHLRDGVTPISDPNLNQYYQPIEQLTRSRDLFSLRRLKTIVAFNLGRYEPLLEAYRRETAEFVKTHHSDVIE